MKQVELTWDVWIVVLRYTAFVRVPEKLRNILLIQTAAVSNPGSLVAAKSNSLIIACQKKVNFQV